MDPISPTSTTSYIAPIQDLHTPEETSSVDLGHVDFYNPNITAVAPLTLAQTNTGIAKGNPVMDVINRDFNKVAKDDRLNPGVYNKPYLTPLGETLRYNDPELGGFSYDDPGNEYHYGNNQGLWDTTKARTMQFAGGLFSSFLGSFTDIPMLGAAAGNLVTGDKDFMGNAVDSYRGLYDNAVSNSLGEMNDWFQSNGTIYNTRLTEAHPLVNILGDIYGSLGYSVGAIGGAITEDLLVGLATGGIGAVPLLGAQLTRAALKVSRILNGSEEAVKVFTSAVKAGRSVDQAVTAAAAVQGGIRNGLFKVNMVSNNFFEAGMEAKTTQAATEQKLRADKEREVGRKLNQQELKEIYATSNRAGNVAFGLNVALLSATNYLEFDDILKGVGKKIGANTSFLDDAMNLGVRAGAPDVVESAAQKAAGEVAEEATGFLGKGKALYNRTRQGLGKSAVTSLSEMVEEGGQFSIEHGVEDYYTTKYGKEGHDWVKDSLSSTLKGVRDTVTTEEGWTNLIAGLGAGVVMAAGKKALGYDKTPDPTALVDYLNSTKLTSILQTMPSSITSAGQAASAAQLNAKTKQTKSNYASRTVADAQLFNWATSALENDKLDLRRDQIKEAKSIKDGDFQRAFGIPYTEENKAAIDQKLNEASRQLDIIEKTHKRVSTLYTNPYTGKEGVENTINAAQWDNYKRELTWQLFKQKSHGDQIVKQSLDLQAQYQGLEVDLLTNLSTTSGVKLEPFGSSVKELNKPGTEDGLQATKKEYLDWKKDLEDYVSDGTASPEDKKQLKVVDQHLADIESLIAGGIADPQEHATVAKKILNGAQERNGSKSFNIADVKEMLSHAKELATYKGSVERTNMMIEKLASKEGFENYMALEKKAWHEFNQAKTKAAVENSNGEPIVPDRIYGYFNQNNATLPDTDKQLILSSIATKVKAKIPLTPREQEIYDVYTSDIDLIITPATGESIITKAYSTAMENGTLKDVDAVTIATLVQAKIDQSGEASLTPKEKQFYTLYRTLFEAILKEREAVREATPTPQPTAAPEDPQLRPDETTTNLNTTIPPVEDNAAQPTSEPPVSPTVENPFQHDLVSNYKVDDEFEIVGDASGAIYQVISFEPGDKPLLRYLNVGTGGTYTMDLATFQEYVKSGKVRRASSEGIISDEEWSSMDGYWDLETLKKWARDHNDKGFIGGEDEERYTVVQVKDHPDITAYQEAIRTSDTATQNRLLRSGVVKEYLDELSSDDYRPTLFVFAKSETGIALYKRFKEIQEGGEKNLIFGRLKDIWDLRSPDDQLVNLGWTVGAPTLNLRSAIEAISQSSYATPSEVILARKLLPFVDPKQEVTLTGSQADGKTRYIPGKGIELNQNQFAKYAIDTALLHELLHQLTSDKLKNTIDIVTGYDSTNKEIKEKTTLRDRLLKMRSLLLNSVTPEQAATYRGLTDHGDHTADEFLAEALTNPQMQSLMARTELGKVKATKAKSIWNSFVKSILDFFGISSTKNDMLTHVTNIVMNQALKNKWYSPIDTVEDYYFNPDYQFNFIKQLSGSTMTDKTLELQVAGKLTNEYISKNAVINVKSPSNPNVSKNPFVAEGFNHIYRRQPDTVYEVVLEGIQIGVLHPYLNWTWRSEGGDNKYLHQIPKSDYIQVTGNKLDTYEAFIEMTRSLYTMHKALEKRANEVKTIPVSDLAQFGIFQMAKPKFAREDDYNDRPMVSELSANFPKVGSNRTPTPYVVSMVKQYDPATDTYSTEVGEVTGLDSNNVQYQAIKQALEANTQLLQIGHAPRYIVALKQPSSERIAGLEDVLLGFAHPRTLTTTELQSIVDEIKQLSAEALANKEGLTKEQVQALNKRFYLADVATKSKQLSFYIANDGNLNYRAESRKKGIPAQSVSLKAEELSAITNIQQLVNAFNKKFIEKGIPSMNVSDFKVNLSKDTEITADQLVTNLESELGKELVRPRLYFRPIGEAPFVPLGGSVIEPEAVPTPDPVMSTPTPVVNTITDSIPEDIYRAFVADKLGSVIPDEVLRGIIQRRGQMGGLGTRDTAILTFRAAQINELDAKDRAAKLASEAKPVPEVVKPKRVLRKPITANILEATSGELETDTPTTPTATAAPSTPAIVAQVVPQSVPSPNGTVKLNQINTVNTANPDTSDFDYGTNELSLDQLVAEYKRVCGS